jgi:HK97 gp10 family phage protein
VARTAIQDAMEKSAQEIVDMMKGLVVVRDGHLRDSIGWTWGKAPKGSLKVGAIMGGSSADLIITIYAGDAEAFYARWIEFGTSPHSTAKGGGTKAGKKSLARGGGIQHPGTRAQPFFFVSYRANKKRAKSRITRAVNKAGRTVAAQGGGK